ncbi:MAG TPA: hypothetical protein DIC64_03700 [Alphaproteobacteria bacterium]|nr:hypothetical protein [Alphaproteobacteria bacterium]
MGIRDMINELKMKNKEPTKAEVVIPVPKSEWEIDAVEAEVVDVDVFPREYDPNLGISPRQFQYLRRRAKNLFESEEKLDQAYCNIPNQLLEKTGKTKAQVLLAYNDYMVDSLHFRAKYIRDPDEATGHVVKGCRYDGLIEYWEFSDADTKNFETFDAMFQGKDISDKEMKTIEDIISICTPGFVAKCVKEEVEIFEHGRVMPIVTVEDCKGEKGKWIPRKSIEPNIPDEFPDDIEIIDTDDMKDKPMPKPIPYKGR